MKRVFYVARTLPTVTHFGVGGQFVSQSGGEEWQLEDRIADNICGTLSLMWMVMEIGWGPCITVSMVALLSIPSPNCMRLCIY